MSEAGGQPNTSRQEPSEEDLGIAADGDQLPIGDWEEVGTVGVDSGRIWLGDPCYLLNLNDDRPTELGRSWRDVVPKMSSGDVVQWFFDNGIPGLGVSVGSGFGDGQYPVYVRRAASGQVAAVMIAFIWEDVE